MDEKEREEFRKGKEILFRYLKLGPVLGGIGTICFFMILASIFVAGGIEPPPMRLVALGVILGVGGFLGVMIYGGILYLRIYYFFVKTLEKVDKKLDLTPDDLANLIASLTRNPKSSALNLIKAIENLESEKSKTSS
ncbi:MAG: hypothetical protein QXW80_04920 [Candidatus Micrarchaeia archaeon]